MTRTILTFFFSIFMIQLVAQNKVDSLLRIAESKQADSTRFEAYNELTYYFVSRDTALAYKYLNEMKFLAERTEITNGKLKVYNLLGNLYQMNGQYDKAIQYYKTGLTVVKDSANIARLIGGIGSSYVYKDFLDSAEHYLTLGYEIKTRWDADDPKSVARSLQNIAMVAEFQNDYKKAIKNYHEALALILPLKEDRSIAVIYNNMGTAYSNTTSWDAAFPYFEKSYKLSKKLDDIRTIGNSATNLGSYYSTKLEYDKAVSFYEEAIEAMKKLGHLYDLTNTYHTLGECYQRMNKPEKAMANLLKGFALADSIGSKRALWRIGTNLSKHKLAEGDLFLAKKFIDRSLVDLEDSDYLESKTLAYKQASKVYEALDDQKQALAYYKIYAESNDSLQAGRENETVKELHIRYETAEKEAMLNSKNLEIEKKTRQRNFYLFGLCLIGVSAILLINRKNLKQKLTEEKVYNLQQKQKLIAVDNMIQGQEDERRRIAKDLHDGLGGLLTSARLQMQKIQQEIDRLGSLQLLKKAETLIDTASEEVRRIAHDMMPDALVNLGMKSAVLDLSNEINQSTPIKVETFFSHDEFDFEDKVKVVLYRIIQELTHNAVKYSQAKNLLIQIMDTGNHYEVTVEDDGIGFNFSEEKAKQGMGLENFITRLNYLGASYQFDNKNGASYLIQIPKA